MNNRSVEKRDARSQLIRDFEAILGDLPTTARIPRMANYIQHGSITTLAHSMRVATLAFILARKLHLIVNNREMIRGALLHDYYLYDWHHTSNRSHALNHPLLAKQNAAQDFELTPKECNIIMSHMWPLPPTRLPLSREAWLVCLADKCCSLQETLFMHS